MMKTNPFQKYVDQYETWFTKNASVYEAELRAVKALLPKTGNGVEVGVGTGRFASRLGIKTGVEPSTKMMEIAKSRGIEVFDGVAEHLPFDNCTFDFVLMVTTICFLDDINKAFQEANRVLSKGGSLIVGEVDPLSPIGQIYLKRQNEDIFYKEANFFSIDEIVKVMDQSGFGDFVFKQTLFGSLSEVTENEPIKDGFGEGSFVVVRGQKK